MIGGLALFVLWLGAWFYISGAATRTVEWAEEKAYNLAASQGFYVQDILVEGRVHASADVLLALLNTERGDPIFAFDPQEAKDLIERISWVKEAHVERRLPQTIYIGLIEREPVALWQNKQKVRLVDIDGVTITDTDIAPFEGLPIIVGETAPIIYPVLRPLLLAEPEISERLEAVIRVGDRRWDLRLKNGVTIKLPEENEAMALRNLARMQSEDNIFGKDLTEIDMRVQGRITVRTSPGAVQEYKASFTGGRSNI